MLLHELFKTTPTAGARRESLDDVRTHSHVPDLDRVAGLEAVGKDFRTYNLLAMRHDNVVHIGQPQRDVLAVANVRKRFGSEPRLAMLFVRAVGLALLLRKVDGSSRLAGI
jgi:hypothetical protein